MENKKRPPNLADRFQLSLLQSIAIRSVIGSSAVAAISVAVITPSSFGHSFVGAHVLDYPVALLRIEDGHHVDELPLTCLPEKIALTWIPDIHVLRLLCEAFPNPANFPLLPTAQI